VIIKTKALVIKEYIVGESDKYITLFSKDMGKIQAIAPKAKKYDQGFTSGTQLFVYGEFMLVRHRSTYRLMSVEVISMFHDIRNDLNVLSYGSYILEFIAEVVQEELSHEDLFMLTLITLKALVKKKLQVKLVRRIFELRALSLLGFMPQLEECAECSSFIEESAFNAYYFVPEAGGIVCDQCISSYEQVLKIGYSTLYTMKFIISTPLNQLFSFNVQPGLLHELEETCNSYMNYYIGKKFKTVDFINQIESI
jgi:DNA repair protein RecO (recombination protein O)